MPQPKSVFHEVAKSRFLAYSLYNSLQDLDLRSTRYLLRVKKANPNYIINEFGVAPIHIAAGIGDDKFGALAMGLCLDSGGDPNVPSVDGLTPMHIAAIWKRKIVLELLVQKGGDLNLRDQDGFTPLDYLQKKDSLRASTSVQSCLHSPQGEKLNLSALRVSSQGGEGLAELTHSGSEYFLAVSDDSEDDTMNKAFLDDCSAFSPEFSDVESASFVESFLPPPPRSPNSTAKSAFIVPYCSPTTLSNIETYPCSPDERVNPSMSVGTCLAQTKSDSKQSIHTGFSSDSGAYYEACDFMTDGSLGSVSSCPTERLKYLLQERQIQHGPIVKSTKRVYLFQLRKRQDGSTTQPPKIQRPEFNDVVVATLTDRLPEYIEKWSKLESEMVESLETAKCEAKLDKSKQYFTYLLLDPLASDLTNKHQLAVDIVAFWPQFLKSIFYVGKGKNSRPQDHLIDAVKTSKIPASEKIKKIRSIWEKGFGVVTIYIFHNITEAEALTREALMILALSNARLTNVQSGRCYGGVAKWTLKRKRQLGAVLLFRAMNLVLAEGARQIFPSDLKT